MLAERRPVFSREESEEIGKVAIDVANRGNDVVDCLVLARFKLMGRIINVFQSNFHQPGILEWVRAMEHEVDVIDEVIRRAKAIFKMEGRDEESECKRMLLAKNFGRLGEVE